MARNDGVDRTTVRNQPRTENNIADAEAHNERQKTCYRNEDIVPERSHMNIHFKTPSGSYQEMFRQMEQDGTISTRGLKQDAIHYGELVFDVNSAYFHNHGGYEFAQAFYAEAYRAAVDIVGGEQYILSAVMHADERNQGMSKALGYDVWHYHLHVVYVPVVEKQILWSKRCKDPALVGTVKETVMQISHSKKWQSRPVLDEFGEPLRTKTGKIVLKKSYSILQDQYHDAMFAAGYASTSVPKKISNIIELLKITAHIDDFPPQTDRIHVANGTLFLDGSFSTAKDRIVRSRFPVAYNPSVPSPETWLGFLHGLLYEDDIPTLQEYIGYCLIPSNKGQRMMVIKGSGGEGKSQIGTVLSHLFGCNAKDGSVGKVSENRFARADLEHIHLLIDDDMRMEALRQTNYVKSLVTAQGRMDLEKKGRQSYQGWMFARLLAFSNGALQSLYDRSNGFYRRQLILTTRERQPDRVDDPDIAEKMCCELEGIFLWAFEGLQRLVANHFRFTESARSRSNREAVKQDANNVLLFMEAGDYIRLTPEGKVGSQELYEIYTVWCRENGFSPLKNRSFSEILIANQKKYSIEHSNNLTNLVGRRVWGFTGIEPVLKLPLRTADGWQRDYSDDNPFV